MNTRRVAEEKWGLTALQLETMQVMAGPASGVTKNAARLLNLEVKTIDKRMGAIVRQMKCRNRVEAILQFDRHYRTVIDPKAPAGVKPCETCSGLGFTRRAA